MKKECKLCGKEFEKRTTKKYCSVRCRERNNQKKREQYVKRYNREYYRKNKEKERLRFEKWKKENENYYKEIKEKSRKKNIKKIKKYSKDYQKRYRKENLEKRKAQNIANYKIEIKPNTLCEICNKKQATDKHHQDYSQPLKIRFLCRSCHLKIHNNKVVLKANKQN